MSDFDSGGGGQPRKSRTFAKPLKPLFDGKGMAGAFGLGSGSASQVPDSDEVSLGSIQELPTVPSVNETPGLLSMLTSFRSNAKAAPKHVGELPNKANLQKMAEPVATREMRQSSGSYEGGNESSSSFFKKKSPGVTSPGKPAATKTASMNLLSGLRNPEAKLQPLVDDDDFFAAMDQGSGSATDQNFGIPSPPPSVEAEQSPKVFSSPKDLASKTRDRRAARGITKRPNQMSESTPATMPELDDWLPIVAPTAKIPVKVPSTMVDQSDDQSISSIYAKRKPLAKETLAAQELARKQQEELRLLMAQTSVSVDVLDDISVANSTTQHLETKRDWQDITGDQNDAFEKKMARQLDRALESSDDDEDFDRPRPKTKEEKKLAEVMRKQREELYGVIENTVDADDALVREKLYTKRERKDAQKTKKWHDITEDTAKPSSQFLDATQESDDDDDDDERGRRKKKDDHKWEAAMRQQVEDLRSTINQTVDAEEALAPGKPSSSREKKESRKTQKAWIDVGPDTAKSNNRSASHIQSDEESEEMMSPSGRNKQAKKLEEQMRRQQQELRDLIKGKVQLNDSEDPAFEASNSESRKKKKTGKDWQGIADDDVDDKEFVSPRTRQTRKLEADTKKQNKLLQEALANAVDASAALEAPSSEYQRSPRKSKNRSQDTSALAEQILSKSKAMKSPGSYEREKQRSLPVVESKSKYYENQHEVEKIEELPGTTPLDIESKWHDVSTAKHPSSGSSRRKYDQEQKSKKPEKPSSSRDMAVHEDTEPIVSVDVELPNVNEPSGVFVGDSIRSTQYSQSLEKNDKSRSRKSSSDQRGQDSKSKQKKDSKRERSKSRSRKSKGRGKTGANFGWERVSSHRKLEVEPPRAKGKSSSTKTNKSGETGSKGRTIQVVPIQENSESRWDSGKLQNRADRDGPVGVQRYKSNTSLYPATAPAENKVDSATVSQEVSEDDDMMDLGVGDGDLALAPGGWTGVKVGRQNDTKGYRASTVHDKAPQPKAMNDRSERDNEQVTAGDIDSVGGDEAMPLAPGEWTGVTLDRHGHDKVYKSKAAEIAAYGKSESMQNISGKDKQKSGMENDSHRGDNELPLAPGEWTGVTLGRPEYDKGYKSKTTEGTTYEPAKSKQNVSGEENMPEKEKDTDRVGDELPLAPGAWTGVTLGRSGYDKGYKSKTTEGTTYEPAKSKQNVSGEENMPEKEKDIDRVGDELPLAPGKWTGVTLSRGGHEKGYKESKDTYEGKESRTSKPEKEPEAPSTGKSFFEDDDLPLAPGEWTGVALGRHGNDTGYHFRESEDTYRVSDPIIGESCEDSGQVGTAKKRPTEDGVSLAGAPGEWTGVTLGRSGYEKGYRFSNDEETYPQTAAGVSNFKEESKEYDTGREDYEDDIQDLSLAPGGWTGVVLGRPGVEIGYNSKRGATYSSEEANNGGNDDKSQSGSDAKYNPDHENTMALAPGGWTGVSLGRSGMGTSGRDHRSSQLDSAASSTRNELSQDTSDRKKSIGENEELTAAPGGWTGVSLGRPGAERIAKYSGGNPRSTKQDCNPVSPVEGMARPNNTPQALRSDDEKDPLSPQGVTKQRSSNLNQKHTSSTKQPSTIVGQAPDSSTLEDEDVDPFAMRPVVNPFSHRPPEAGPFAERPPVQQLSTDDESDNMTTQSEDGHLAKQASRRSLLRQKVHDRREALSNILHTTKEATWHTDNEVLDLKRKLALSQALVEKLELENEIVKKESVLAMAKAQSTLLIQRQNREQELEAKIFELMNQRNEAVLECHELRILLMGSCDMCRGRFDQHKQYAMDFSVRNTILSKREGKKSSAFEWFTGGLADETEGVKLESNGKRAKSRRLDLDALSLDATLPDIMPSFGASNETPMHWLSDKLFRNRSEHKKSETTSHRPMIEEVIAYADKPDNSNASSKQETQQSHVGAASLPGVSDDDLLKMVATELEVSQEDTEEVQALAAAQDLASPDLSNSENHVMQPLSEDLGVTESAPAVAAPFQAAPSNRKSFFSNLFGERVEEDFTTLQQAKPQQPAAPKKSNFLSSLFGERIEGDAEFAGLNSSNDAKPAGGLGLEEGPESATLRGEKVLDDMAIFNSLLASEASAKKKPSSTKRFGLSDEMFDGDSRDTAILSSPVARKSKEKFGLSSEMHDEDTRDAFLLSQGTKSKEEKFGLSDEMLDDDTRDATILSPGLQRRESGDGLLDGSGSPEGLGAEKFDENTHDAKLLEILGDAKPSSTTTPVHSKGKFGMPKGLSPTSKLTSPFSSQASRNKGMLSNKGRRGSTQAASYLGRFAAGGGNKDESVSPVPLTGGVSAGNRMKPRISMMNHVPMDVELEGERPWRSDSGPKSRTSSSSAAPVLEEDVEVSIRSPSDDRPTVEQTHSDDDDDEGDLDHIAALLAVEGM
eukprot:Nitzschia sp. Nitz4//scaffold174_size87051//72247//79476//NITZ4_005121-RA/size87051-snap-gene-0.107-mRNA-1//1//CDS//3329538908//7242//frame0